MFNLNVCYEAYFEGGRVSCNILLSGFSPGELWQLKHQEAEYFIKGCLNDFIIGFSEGLPFCPKAAKRSNKHAIRNVIAYNFF